MRVLLLTHRLPYAPNRGDRIRAYHLLKQLSRSFEVDVVSLVHDDEEVSHVRTMQSLASRVVTARVPRFRNAVRTAAAVLTTIPATHTMLDAPDLLPKLRRHIAERRPSVVLAYCSGMARLATARELESIPLLLDMVDVDSLKWAALSQKSRPPKSWIYAREARTLGQFEREITRQATVTLVTTEAERVALRGIAGTDRIKVIENGIELESFRSTAPPAPSSTIVFCGVMNYAPNVEAAVWLAREVWPEVRRRHSEAVLQLVGASPSSAVRNLASAQSGVEVSGTVPDVRPYLWNAAAAAAPLFVARGIQNKVLEAVAAGLPVALTPQVAAALPPQVRPFCHIADDPRSFAAVLLALIAASVEERTKVREHADLSELSWNRRLADLPALVTHAASGSA